MSGKKSGKQLTIHKFFNPKKQHKEVDNKKDELDKDKIDKVLFDKTPSSNESKHNVIENKIKTNWKEIYESNQNDDTQEHSSEKSLSRGNLEATNAVQDANDEEKTLEVESKIPKYLEVEEDLPPSPKNIRESIKQKFLVEMPDDFYSFFSLCRNMCKENPCAAFSKVNLYLVGPYDVLDGRRFRYHKQSEYLRHWRFYYDTPEFQTVVYAEGKDEFHLGYYRDDPNEMPCFVASNKAAQGCTLVPVASNILAAVHSYISSLLNDADPIKKSVIKRYLDAIIQWAKSNGFHINNFIPGMNTRKRKMVSKTFHGAGIVVPVDKKEDTGYRDLLLSEANLKKLLKKIVTCKAEEERSVYISELQPVLTAAMIAVDECDFGTALELGINLFCFGGEVFHPMILQNLTTAYNLLQRQEFSQIIEAHLQNRKRTNPSSELLARETVQADNVNAMAKFESQSPERSVKHSAKKHKITESNCSSKDIPVKEVDDNTDSSSSANTISHESDKSQFGKRRRLSECEPASISESQDSSD